MKTICFLIITLPCVLVFGQSPKESTEIGVTSKSSATSDRSDFFETHIRPLLVKHCYACHSEEAGERNGGLLLDRESGWLEGGDLGKAVIPGDADGSLLIQAVRADNEDLQMPPDEPLDDASVALLEKWVRLNAPGPRQDLGETEFSQLGDQDLIFEEAKTHWSFQPIRRVTPPRVANRRWNKHPIDGFVYQRLSTLKLRPSKQATSATLRKRIAFDLTGLPPEDDAPQLLDPLIDELLESPHFGEHFARLWLDVARYADTANVTVPATRPSVPTYYPFAFTYRDYVVASFNKDKPYTEFIKEQLAADLMGFDKRAPEQAALGFLAVTPFLTNPHDFADDAIDTVTRGLMGLTVSCARCHDHKFEPVPTADYYSLHGVFSSIEKPKPYEYGEFPVIDGYEITEAQKEDYTQKRSIITEKIAEAKKSGRVVGGRRPYSDIIKQSEMSELLLVNKGAPVRAIIIKEADAPVTSKVFLRGEPSMRGDEAPRRFLEDP